MVCCPCNTVCPRRKDPLELPLSGTTGRRGGICTPPFYGCLFGGFSALPLALASAGARGFTDAPSAQSSNQINRPPKRPGQQSFPAPSAGVFGHRPAERLPAAAVVFRTVSMTILTVCCSRRNSLSAHHLLPGKEKSRPTYGTILCCPTPFVRASRSDWIPAVPTVARTLVLGPFPKGGAAYLHRPNSH